MNTITKIIFDTQGCWVTVDGRRCALSEKITLPEVGKTYLCYDDGIEEYSEDVRLVELAARWWLWSNDLLPESVAENPQPLSEADAALALENHLAAVAALDS